MNMPHNPFMKELLNKHRYRNLNGKMKKYNEPGDNHVGVKICKYSTYNFSIFYYKSYTLPHSIWIQLMNLYNLDWYFQINFLIGGNERHKVKDLIKNACQGF